MITLLFARHDLVVGQGVVPVKVAILCVPVLPSPYLYERPCF